MTELEKKELAKKALYWWIYTLTTHGRMSFPEPKKVGDIMNYYENPSEHRLLEYR